MKCDTCGVNIFTDCFNGECESCFKMTEEQWYEFLSKTGEDEDE